MQSLGFGLVVLLFLIVITLSGGDFSFSTFLLLAAQLTGVIAILYRMVRGGPNRSE